MKYFDAFDEALKLHPLNEVLTEEMNDKKVGEYRYKFCGYDITVFTPAVNLVQFRIVDYIDFDGLESYEILHQQAYIPVDAPAEAILSLFRMGIKSGLLTMSIGNDHGGLV